MALIACVLPIPSPRVTRGQARLYHKGKDGHSEIFSTDAPPADSLASATTDTPRAFPKLIISSVSFHARHKVLHKLSLETQKQKVKDDSTYL